MDETIKTQIDTAAGIIRNGGLVAFPTETVYGLGANALDTRAAARVFEAKRRPFFDPLILHVLDADWLDDLAAGVPPLAVKLIDKFWPGPLTVVLPKKPDVPDIVTAGLPSAAIRSPSNGIARALIMEAGVPIAAPSANLFGSVSPTTACHVREQLGESVDMIIDGGECTVGIESTIVSFMDARPALLRPGGTPLEEIEETIGKVIIPKPNEQINRSPGRADSHYATSAPLFRVDDINRIDGDNNKKIGLMALMPFGDDLPSNITTVEYLSKNGDLREAAANLFATMRRLDKSGVDMIISLPIPNAGLGLAINDRLYRASMK